MAPNQQLEIIELGAGWLQAPIEDGQLTPFITTNAQANAATLAPQRLTCFYEPTDITRKLPATKIVNALLVYSVGQLALAPCIRCTANYDRDGRAMPFPDCVFLPNYWNFACACCIASGDAVSCSFNITRKEHRHESWEQVTLSIDSLSPDLIAWLKRGHPLSTIDTDRPLPFWKRLPAAKGRGLPHNLAEPLQDPPFVFPPECWKAQLPNRPPWNAKRTSTSNLSKARRRKKQVLNSSGRRNGGLSKTSGKRKSKSTGEW